jgi:hypothetical protein
MKHLQLLLNMQAVRNLLYCSWLTLLFHDAALHHWESGTSSFETIMFSCNVVTYQPVMQCHIAEEQRSFFCVKKKNSCNLSYVGQTSRSLKVRYQEHIRYIRLESCNIPAA